MPFTSPHHNRAFSESSIFIFRMTSHRPLLEILLRLSTGNTGSFHTGSARFLPSGIRLPQSRHPTTTLIYHFPDSSTKRSLHHALLFFARQITSRNKDHVISSTLRIPIHMQLAPNQHNTSCSSLRPVLSSPNLNLSRLNLRPTNPFTSFENTNPFFATWLLPV
jgi:hypothetical protein